ncbi:MAG: glucose-6-phosphate isomerase [Odoribacter sp.]|uniref:glucose-6-phosphate isomerase n=1 Tax=Bacteroides fluxus TaxID=626930 RepID=UPI0023F098FA|nr:glucose-6-phosphate isomerase [Bacteroides fluxus]MCI5707334.1 glucose-6-phosphate isomerase [Odoribacter sp.]
MERIKFDYSKICSFVDKEDFAALMPQAQKAMKGLVEGTCKGNDFLGWLNLPVDISTEEMADIEKTAANLRARTQVVVVIGIGGSYLGARAVIEALSNSFHNYESASMKVIFAGHNISEDYYYELQNYLENKEFGICVISKSGTTTEPAIAFRLLKELLEKKVGREEAGRRIVAITDAKKGALRTLADQEGYKTFVIPDNVGGRFSVLTPVGLLPIAIAGFNIRELVQGAIDMRNDCLAQEVSPALEYAVARMALYRKGYAVEILANFHPKLHYITEWWKQLYGESEGKENRGIFPAGADFTTDLHSMGQYIQQGVRFLMETVISVAKPDYKVEIPADEANLDKLNFLAGKRVDEVNKMAELGTQIAHVDGGVPNMKVIMPTLNALYIGQLFYFFEFACGISGSMLGVNPFDQPGVEAYKNNMFALLDKPGYEEASRAIKAKL